MEVEFFFCPRWKKKNSSFQKIPKGVIPHNWKINSCLYNKFKNGFITGDHSDLKYKSKLPDNVYLLCFGETRPFVFTSLKTNKNVEILLEEGMFLHVSTQCNTNYKHGRPEFETKIESFSMRETSNFKLKNNVIITYQGD